MPKPEFLLSPELDAWDKERKTEPELSRLMTEFSKITKEGQARNRQEALRILRGEEGVLNFNFESIDTYLKTPGEERAPEDTADFYSELESISNAFGEKFVVFMYREWKISRHNSPEE